MYTGQLNREEFGGKLFCVIQCYAGYEQVRRYQQRMRANDGRDPTRTRLNLARWCTEEARLREEIQQGLPALTNDDALRLMERYEPDHRQSRRTDER